MMKEKYPKGILLDLGCKSRKEPNFVGMDWRDHPGVDIVHNLEVFPYPLDENSCLTIKCAHVIEHIKPWLVLEFMDELWRLLLPNGQLAISAPYAGSPGFLQDPTHCCMVTERTWQLFDPNFPLYKQYEPKPWHIEYSAYKPDGNIEAIMRKVSQLDVSKSLDLASKAVMELGAMQKPTELMMFFEALKGKRLKTIVEIGTANGGVLWALCCLADPDATIVSIDLPGGEFGGGYSVEAVERMRKFAVPPQKLYFLREDSHKKATKDNLKAIIKNTPIDVLFIDGDHTYEGVKMDYEMYSPLVRKGGIIAFHDIVLHLNVPRCEVEKFWKEVKKRKTVAEYIDQNDTTWGGIGVIVK